MLTCNFLKGFNDRAVLYIIKKALILICLHNCNLQGGVKLSLKPFSEGLRHPFCLYFEP